VCSYSETSTVRCHRSLFVPADSGDIYKNCDTLQNKASDQDLPPTTHHLPFTHNPTTASHHPPSNTAIIIIAAFTIRTSPQPPFHPEILTRMEAPAIPYGSAQPSCPRRRLNLWSLPRWSTATAIWPTRLASCPNILYYLPAFQVNCPTSIITSRYLHKLTASRSHCHRPSRGHR
jgi:hypothetical protein